MTFLVALISTHLLKIVYLDAALIKLILQLLQLDLEFSLLTLAYFQIAKEASLVVQMQSVTFVELLMQCLDLIIFTHQSVLILG